MPITGVYFIPSNPNASTALGTVTERLHTALSDEPIPVGRWALEHKLMRDTPSCLPSQRSIQPRYMQFLSTSYYPSHGFIYTSEASEPALNAAAQAPASAPGNMADAAPHQSNNSPTVTPPNNSGMVMTTVPIQSYGTLFQHFVYACQPFWCHRHTVTVPGGVVYDVGDFRVRVGDVRQTQPTSRVRGTVVEIEWRGPSLISSILAQSRRWSPETGETDTDSGIGMAPSDVVESDVDAEYAAIAALIREFWARLGVEGREAILVPGVGKEVKERLGKWREEAEGKRGGTPDENEQQDVDMEAGVDEARQFMEALRFNR